MRLVMRRRGAASPEQLVDWLTRMMISAVLLPDPDPDGMARSLTAVFALLAGPAASSRPGRRRTSSGSAQRREGRKR